MSYYVDMTCQYWSQEGDRICLLHASDSFSMAINIVSAVLVLIGIFFDVLVLIFVGDMPIYGDEGDGEYRMIPMERFNVANRDVAGKGIKIKNMKHNFIYFCSW